MLKENGKIKNSENLGKRETWKMTLLTGKKKEEKNNGHLNSPSVFLSSLLMGLEVVF
jgi:hypothetical protein